MRSNEGCLSESVMPQKKTMATRIEAVRGLYWRAAYSMDKGKPAPSLISMAKWNAGETAVYVANEALQLHGGYGYISEYDIQRFYRDAKIVEIYEGSKEVEKAVIASELLKKAFLVNPQYRR